MKLLIDDCSYMAPTCCYRYQHTFCITTDLELLELDHRCSLPDTALNLVDLNMEQAHQQDMTILGYKK